jgi:endonuclease/exonuclease/phosphatase family metal-dependent hydrolase
MGDFNFLPDSEQYALTVETYTDAFHSAPIQEMVPPGQDTADRIDHIFLSPGLIPQKVIYVGEGPSDHPAVFLELAQ